MPEAVPQNFANHRQLVPTFHFVLAGILVANLVVQIIRLVQGPNLDTVMATGLAGGLVLLFFHTRQFATGLQERIIRLEMQIRLRSILPDDLKARIPELTRSHYIGLRFASDAEVPHLMREALDQKIASADEIKKKVTDWQADNWRI